MFLKPMKKTYPGFINKLLNKKNHQWRLCKRTNSERNKIKYKAIRKECISEINKFYADKELKLIDNGNLGSFFKYVNCRTSFKSGVAPLKNENGVIQYDDLEKARLLNINFSSNFTADNNILPNNNKLLMIMEIN